MMTVAELKNELESKPDTAYVIVLAVNVEALETSELEPFSVEYEKGEVILSVGLMDE